LNFYHVTFLFVFQFAVQLRRLNFNFACVVLYGCETWSITLREKRRLKMFKNRVLRRIFGPKRDEVTGEWRKLHNEGLNDRYCTPNIGRVRNYEF